MADIYRLTDTTDGIIYDIAITDEEQIDKAKEIFSSFFGLIIDEVKKYTSDCEYVNPTIIMAPNQFEEDFLDCSDEFDIHITQK